MKISMDQPGADNIRIEIVPLIDVIFCILTFFILAALQLTRQQSISVELPSAGTATLQSQQALLVTVDALGKTYVENSEVSPSQLYLILEGYRRTNPLGIMLLYADRNAIYNDVINILDLMRSVGGNRVALATLPPNLPSQKPPTSPLNPNPAPSAFPQIFPQSSTLPQSPTLPLPSTLPSDGSFPQTPLQPSVAPAPTAPTGG